MNFVFISPNFPENYWMFCRGLKRHGATVLAIVDCPYDSLREELRAHIDDCYVVSSMENYDEMVRAMGYFTYRYGKIDWVESNNEYWLSLDARLRQDFHITTGITIDNIADFQSKSRMKHFYAQAGIPCARWQMADTLDSALAFAAQYGYPLICKPDVGVGASNTHKLNNEEELRALFEHGFSEPMILEEYVPGDCFTFDGITNSRKEMQFATSHHYVGSIMDSVNDSDSIGCYSLIDIPEDIMDVGTRCVAAFDTRSRFFHFEFFRLREDREGLGKQGDILGLEVNMRPPGGFLPDMINYANDFDIYDIWARVMIDDGVLIEPHQRHSCAFAGRRDSVRYAHSDFEISNRYHDQLKMMQRLPAALASAMGDTVSVALFDTMDEVKEFFAFTMKKKVQQ